MRNPHNGKAVADYERGIILVSADIHEDPATIFNALTKPEEIEKWWADPEYYRMTQWQCDFQVGGEYSAVMLMGDGSQRPLSGRFLEIDFPRKISLTRRYDWDLMSLGRNATTVSFMIRARDGGSRLTIRHEGFNGLDEAIDQDARHWEFVLGWLNKYFIDNWWSKSQR